MGRGRGKGKKQTIIAANDDPGHGEEDKPPASNKRRRQPQKPLKDEEEDEKEAEKVEDEENAKSSTASKDSTESVIDKGRKRKKPTEVKENSDPIKEENSSDSNGNFIKSVGFRPNKSRRKNKPCRAAEVGVKCRMTA